MLIDSHAHLEMSDYDSDRDEVLERASQAGIEAVVTVGTTLPDAAKAVELARRHAPVYAAVGIHPHEVGQIDGKTYDALRALAREPKVVALGEIGLDFYYQHSPQEIQIERFREQLALAEELGLPVIIHDREAHGETLAILGERAGRLQGVLHCFSGDLAMAHTCLRMGFYLSIAGPVTYKNADRLREVAREAPLERLLLETDAPYLTPQPLRGKRNEPAYVRHTAEYVAGLRGVPLAELARQTRANTRRLFSLVEKGRMAPEQGL